MLIAPSFIPPQVSLDSKCVGGVENEVPYDMSKAPKPCPKGTIEHRVPASAVVIPVLISLLALGGVIAVIIIYNKRKNYWRTRYLQLATGDHDDELDDNDLGFSESEDKVCYLSIKSLSRASNRQCLLCLSADEFICFSTID